MSCAVCGGAGAYCENMARTLTYCSRECHGKAIDSGLDDRARWLHDPNYRALADRSAIEVGKQVVADQLERIEQRRRSEGE